jgi:hypothetical protein
MKIARCLDTLRQRAMPAMNATVATRWPRRHQRSSKRITAVFARPPSCRITFYRLLSAKAAPQGAFASDPPLSSAPTNRSSPPLRRLNENLLKASLSDTKRAFTVANERFIAASKKRRGTLFWTKSAKSPRNAGETPARTRKRNFEASAAAARHGGRATLRATNATESHGDAGTFREDMFTV